MKVNTNALQQYANEMKPAISAMLETRDTVSQIADRLMEESIGQRFRTPILMSGRDIQQLALEMIKLQQLLEQIAERYEKCENRVEDHAELGTQGIRRLPTGYVPNPKLPPLAMDTVPRPDWMIGPRTWERWIHIAPWRPGLLGIRPGWWRPQNILRVIWPHRPLFSIRPVPGINLVLGGAGGSVAWRSLVSD